MLRKTEICPSLHDVEEDRNLPTDPNVGEHAVMRSPLTMNPAPMENAAVIIDEPNARVRRSARSRLSPAWMEDFFLGKDFNNVLPPLGRRVCNVGKGQLVPVSSPLEPRVCCCYKWD